MAKDFRKYSCIPKLNIKKSAIAVSACLIGAICMLAVSEIKYIFSEYFRMGALVSTFIGVMLAVRLFSVSFVYSICADDESGELYLTIHRVKKKKSVKVCDVNLYNVAELIEFDILKSKRIKDEKKPKRPKMDRKKYKHCMMYNYCADILPERYCLLRLEGENAEYIKFSPDQTMIDIIKSQIY